MVFRGMAINVKVLVCSFFWSSPDLTIGFDIFNLYFYFGHGPDIDECSEGLACQCEGCSCKNMWGGYYCSEKHYIMEEDTSIGNNNSP